MRCPAVVGGSAFVGYNSKQCYWTIGAKTKCSTQAEDPHLNVETTEGSSFWTDWTVNHCHHRKLYLGAVGADGDSEQVHGHKHPSHHADQDGVTGVPVESHSLLHKTWTSWDDETGFKNNLVKHPLYVWDVKLLHVGIVFNLSSSEWQSRIILNGFLSVCCQEKCGLGQGCYH